MSEERLQQQLIEVVNKADLLTDHDEPEHPSHEAAAAVTTDQTLSNASDAADDPPALENSSAALQISDSVLVEQQDSRALLTEDSSIKDGFLVSASQQEASDCEQSYDVQPRRVNANLDWLRERQTQAGAPAVLLTSAITGEGLRKLMVEIASMVERRQDCAASEEKAATL